MEFATRSRQRQHRIKGSSERSSRSLSKQRERVEHFELGPKRSSRGKVDGRGRKGRRGQSRGRLQKVLSEAESTESNNKAAKKCETQNNDVETAEMNSPYEGMENEVSTSVGVDTNAITDKFKEDDQRFADEKLIHEQDKAVQNHLAEAADKDVDFNQYSESKKELSTSDYVACDSPSDLHSDMNDNQDKDYNPPSHMNNELSAGDNVACDSPTDLHSDKNDNEEKEHNLPSDMNNELSAGDNAACDSPSHVNGDSNNDNDELSEGVDKVFPTKRRNKRRRRFNPKKKETRTSEKVVEVSKNQTLSAEESKGEGTRNADDSDKDDDYAPKAKKNRLGLSMVSKLQTSKGFVDKFKFGIKPEEIIPMKRTPRMASLNAIAKVNAVLESYSPLAGKTAGKAKESGHAKKVEAESKSKMDKRRKRSTSSVTQTDDLIYFPPLRDAKDDWTVSSATSSDVFTAIPSHFHDQPISDSRVSSTSNCFSDDEGAITTKDQAVQTVVNHKAVQTDSYLMQDRASEVLPGNLSNCTCNTPENSSNDTPPVTTCYKIPPTVPGNSLNVPLRSSILTKTTTHSIAIPFTKTHVLSHMDMGNLENFPSQVSNVQSNKRMASLNAIAMMNAMKVLDRPFLSLTNLNSGPSKRRDIDRSDRNGSGSIRIPKINFQATSTSKFGGSNKGKVINPAKSTQLKSLSSQLEKLMENKKPDVKASNKMVNGWLFEGDPLEKPVVYDDKVVIRRYYTSMRRNAEVINVRDAVLLKSGPRKKDLPFVARVASIWEEEDGCSSGDMMISVFWYYRPEQTEVGKIPGYNGDLEVLASRHRDDNSAACVVDKCYVLSYPQYCRFRARNKLFRESRKVPLSPVPPSESTRPGSMPPANIDPNLVFFCRHAYDSRTGKIIKNPFY